MKNSYNLSVPFFVLAPMDDVTDTVFRQIIADCAPADLYFTEFVNVDGLQSPGREKLLPKLRFTDKERPLIAQVWGKDPENFYKTAKELVEMGFDGIDINFGCPEKNIVRNNTCSAFILPENREQAIQIIKACREGLASALPSTGSLSSGSKNTVAPSDPLRAHRSYGYASLAVHSAETPVLHRAKPDTSQSGGGQMRSKTTSLPLSVKTRLGFSDVDLTWHETLFNQKLNMLTIHGRTRKQMSKVPADWEMIGRIRQMRDELSPTTLIVGNGDVLTRKQGEKLAEKYKLDGIMIGRGVFQDPYIFSNPMTGGTLWQDVSKQGRMDLYRKHVQLFADTWKNNERKVITLNKFCKIYVNGFDGAKELREQLMAAQSTDQLLLILK